MKGVRLPVCLSLAPEVPCSSMRFLVEPWMVCPATRKGALQGEQVPWAPAPRIPWLMAGALLQGFFTCTTPEQTQVNAHAAPRVPGSIHLPALWRKAA